MVRLECTPLGTRLHKEIDSLTPPKIWDWELETRVLRRCVPCLVGLTMDYVINNERDISLFYGVLCILNCLCSSSSIATYEWFKLSAYDA